MEENVNAGAAPQPTNTQSSSQEETKAQVLGLIAKIEAHLDEYMVTKAPFQIPMEGKELLAKIAPYLIIVFSVLSIPAVLALFGLSAFLAPAAMVAGVGMSWGWYGIVSAVSMVVSLAFNVMAISGLFKRTRASWRLLFYSTLVSFVGSVLVMNLIGAIIGGIIGWYLLFQVKALYKN